MTSKPSDPKQSKGLDLTSERAKAATGSEDRELQVQMLTNLNGTLWFYESDSHEVRESKLNAAITLLASMKPTDALEGMLASQMVATHSAALECLRRAMIHNQSFAGRDSNLKHANKLLATFARQMDALNKHRGKGQQSVTVKHVHVADGGQAIVGNVTTGAPTADPDQRPAPEHSALPYDPGEAMDVFAPPAPARKKTKL